MCGQPPWDGMAAGLNRTPQSRALHHRAVGPHTQAPRPATADGPRTAQFWCATQPAGPQSGLAGEEQPSVGTAVRRLLLQPKPPFPSDFPFHLPCCSELTLPEESTFPSPLCLCCPGNADQDLEMSFQLPPKTSPG